MTYACPKDASHQSTDSDYCSVCGAKIQGALGSLNAPTAASATVTADGVNAAAGVETCPDCGTPRHDGARFCEVCRYNFAARASGTVPPVVVSMPPLPVSALPADEPIVAPAALAVDAPPVLLEPAADITNGPTLTVSPDIMARSSEWEIRAVVDASLYAEPDPNVPAPVGEAERVFPLDVAEMLIGRRSERKDIRPEISLNDPGISHRHAKLLRQPTGGFLLLDVGSTNGTQLNGVDVQPGVRTPLREGDEITLGCWTRITVHERQTIS